MEATIETTQKKEMRSKPIELMSTVYSFIISICSVDPGKLLRINICYPLSTIPGIGISFPVQDIMISRNYKNLFA